MRPTSAGSVPPPPSRDVLEAVFLVALCITLAILTRC